MENMQSKLFEAAKQGSIHSLQQLLKHDPLILDIAAVSCFNESSPLHVAAMLGHVEFVKEIVRVKPELVDELNSQKSTPLHLASAKGHVEVVRALISVDRGACLACDRNELTPLHLAAAKGRVEVVKVLLEAQPDAAYRGKSIIHLCVERCQLEALKILVRVVGEEEAFINSVDADGNSVLHLAVADKQVETVKFLVSVGVEVNAVNNERMTALDVLIRSRRDLRDSEIEKSLKHGGGYRSATLETNNNNTRTRRSADKKDKEESWESSVKKHEDWLEKTKSGLMVVASLIATMAFQIGVNPPGGVWQDDKTLPDGSSAEAGSSVFGHKYPNLYRNFYIINTVAFIASLSIILLLMSGFRMRRRFFMWILVLTTWVAISAIALSYIFAIDTLTPGDKYDSIVGVIQSTIIVWLVLMALLLITHTIRLIIMLVRKIQDYSLEVEGAEAFVIKSILVSLSKE